MDAFFIYQQDKKLLRMSLLLLKEAIKGRAA